MRARIRPSTVGWLLVAMLASVLVALATGTVVERQAKARFADSVATDARLRQALLASEIARFRLMPLVLADDSDVIAALRGQPRAARALDVKLEALARRSGAAVIYVIQPGGRALSASNWRGPGSFVGVDYRERRYYRDAIAKGVGEQFALGSISRQPGLYLARRIRDGGVVVVKLNFAAVERQWARAGGITFVTDAAGVILVTSRLQWRFATTQPIADTAAATARAEIGIDALRSPPIKQLGDSSIAVTGVRGTWLMATTAADASGWRVNLALPVRNATGAIVRAAQLASGLLALVLSALIWGWRGRNRRRAQRTLALETAVAERTADLSREIEERAAAEAQAAELRDGLRQANRLATLGQVTASVAHETAQPVAAIRNYAASGEQLLDRGETEEVRGNLRAIARLTERIGTVTEQLRSFARKGSGELTAVALSDVIDGARLMLKERLSAVTLVLPDLPPDLKVIAGRVRLEQVIINLLQNATEALKEVAGPRITIALDASGDDLRLTICDNGPGVAPDIAARIFTPFVTSRAKGLGLGLVISQDIMIDLGGALRYVPSDTGACFEVQMRRAS